MREAEEKQRRAREGREKAEAERAARAERKRALVDMNAHEAQEGVMDSLMEALQTGAAFSRPDQRRKRQTRAAGGKLILIKDKSGAKIMRTDSTRQRIFDGILLSPINCVADLGKVEDVDTTNNIQTERVTNGSGDFHTPVEDQSLYKQNLLHQAKITPKKGQNTIRRLVSQTRETRLKKNMTITCFSERHDSTTSNAESMDKSTTGTIPKSGKAKSLFDSPSFVTVDEFRKGTPLKLWSPVSSSPPKFTPENVRRPSFYKEIENCVAPVKSKPNRVIVGKRHKRNSIVRRASSNRKKLLKKSSLVPKNCNTINQVLGSPSNLNSSMPIATANAFASPLMSALDNTYTTLNGISKSVDDLKSEHETYSSTPLPTSLMRTKNFENIAVYQDENQNDISLGIASKLQSSESVSILSPRTDMSESIKTVDMSGIADLSRDNSPFNVTNQTILIQTPNSDKSIEIIDINDSPKTNSIISDNDDEFFTPCGGRASEHTIFTSHKKGWKFWQKIGDGAKVVATKYKLKTRGLDETEDELTPSSGFLSPQGGDESTDLTETIKPVNITVSITPTSTDVAELIDSNPRRFVCVRRNQKYKTTIASNRTSPSITPEMRQAAMKKMNKHAKSFINAQKDIQRLGEQSSEINHQREEPQAGPSGHRSLLKDVLDPEIQLRKKNETSPNSDLNNTNSPSKPIERYNSWRATSMF